MTIAAGSRLGPYEIVAPIGAGGMGEVWKARDTRLDRSVAIKILPSEFAHDAQFKVRFEREAKTISQLTHPHICTLYDVGNESGVEYLVMELLDGESLADRLTRGPLPIEQVLRYGAEIAEALHVAHRAGVVHRDLKPGNIMLTKNGAKLLDFGLAKPATAVLAPLTGATVMPTEQKPLTREGTIVGTFQYMAPEQVEGHEADSRTDIFALGALLYEMATGKRAFEGASKASLIASILDRQPPPISTVAPASPPALDRVIRKCLEKDPEQRWQSAYDIAAELRWIADAGVDMRPRTTARWRERAAWITAALLAVAVVTTVALYLRQVLAPKQQVRFAIPPPPTTSWDTFNSLSISPDGKHVVFFARGTDPRGMLFIRNIDSLAAQPLAGTEDASFPFWSPDSRWIGYFVPGKLRKISVSGGPPQTLCDAPDGRGGSWSEGGVILFVPTPRAVVHRVPAAGGIAVPVLTLDASHEDRQDWPKFLADGKHFIFRSSWLGRNSIVAASVDSKEPRKKLLDADAAIVVASDHLLYLREGTAFVQQLDARTLALTGEAVPVTEDLGYNDGTGYAAVASSVNNTLVYRAGTSLTQNQLAWFDRTGRETAKITQIGFVGEPALSPDETHLAYSVADPSTRRTDIWVADVARGTSSRLTFDAADELSPLWSPDGARIAYTLHTSGTTGAIYERPSNGSGTPVLRARGAADILSDDWSRDGRYLLYEDFHSATRRDLFALDLVTGQSIPVVASFGGDYEGKFSPDAKYVAYASNESGRAEVYVQTFPPTGGKWQISNAGGVQPVWSRNGREILYLDLTGKLAAAAVTTEGARFEAGIPQTLFAAPIPGSGDDFRHYTATRDGQRFVFDPATRQAEPTPITVVTNWRPDGEN